MKEIGSEFWKVTPQRNNRKYFLSGRTALEFIIRDILMQHDVNKVLLPSYCCHTMIEPFVRHGFNIRFYDVYFDIKVGLSVRLPESQTNEIFYYMTYFGFAQINGLDVQKIREKYSIIISDCTHSWLSVKNNAIKADYSFISYRKWNKFSGLAEANKYKGDFNISVSEQLNEKYVLKRENAFALKKAFINGSKSIQKNEFLKEFNEAEEILEEDYIGYGPSNEDLKDFLNTDWDKIKEIRKCNAKILIDGIKNIHGITLMFDKLSLGDVPLFVPILLNENRDDLKRYLINNRIYCPIHWPISNLHINISKLAKKIYASEISLICDQRYKEKDMKKIVKLINQYYE